MKSKMSVEKHKDVFNFLCGANYGCFLLMKYIERSESQPWAEFIKEEIKRFE